MNVATLIESQVQLFNRAISPPVVGPKSRNDASDSPDVKPHSGTPATLPILILRDDRRWRLWSPDLEADARPDADTAARDAIAVNVVCDPDLEIDEAATAAPAENDTQSANSIMPGCNAWIAQFSRGSTALGSNVFLAGECLGIVGTILYFSRDFFYSSAACPPAT